MLDAKQRLIKDLEERLKGSITVDGISAIKGAAMDVLEEYDVQYCPPMSNSTDDVLEAYLNAKEIEGRSQKTIRLYRYIISRAMKVIGIPARRASVYDLRRYLAKEKAKGLADSSLENIRQIINAYYNWMSREGLIKTNPAANLGAIKCARTIKKAYSDIEIEKIKATCATKRDKALVTFLAATGCRVSEVVALNRGDVDLNKLECLVHGKGDKERTVFIDSVTAAFVKEYLNSRKDQNTALFAGQGGKRLECGGVRAMLKTVGEKAGIDNVHPHRFRRTLATNLIKRGMPIEEVASILGHDKLDTTMKYVVLIKDNVKNAYLRYA